MSEIFGEKAGISRLEKNIFVIFGEMMFFVVFLMLWLFSKTMAEMEAVMFSPGMITFLLIGFLISCLIMTVHIFYLAYLWIVLVRDEKIKELSTRMYRFETFIVPRKKITLRSYSKRTMQPTPMVQAREQTERLINSAMIKYICRKLQQRELPTEFNLDLIFKSLQKNIHWGEPNDLTKAEEKEMYEIVEEAEKLADDLVVESFEFDSQIMQKIGKNLVNVGPREVINAFLLYYKKKFTSPKHDNIFNAIQTVAETSEELVKKYSQPPGTKKELYPFIYFFEQKIMIDNKMGFKDLSLRNGIGKKDRKVINEINTLFGASDPKSVIIWRPYDQSDPERKIYKFNEIINDYIPSYVVEGTYFFMGSVAGIPILLDILSIEQLKNYYDARFDLAGLNNLKLDALTFLLVALAERWDRRNQTEKRNDLYSKVTQFQTELATKQIDTFLKEAKEEVKNRKSDITFIPKKLDLTFWIAFTLGFLLAGIGGILLFKFGG